MKTLSLTCVILVALLMLAPIASAQYFQSKRCEKTAERCVNQIGNFNALLMQLECIIIVCPVMGGCVPEVPADECDALRAALYSAQAGCAEKIMQFCS